MLKRLIVILFSISLIPIFSAMEIENNNLTNNNFMIINPTEVIYDGWNYSGGIFCAEFPAILVNFSLVWKINTDGVYNLFLIFTHEYDFEHYFDNSTSIDYEYQSFGYVEISNDDEETWDILAIYTGTGNGTENIDITSWASGNLSLRFRCIGVGDNYFSSNHGGSWCLENIKVQGMQDNNPPISTIKIIGNLEVNGWYNTEVGVTINASDEETGVKEIHYKLNGIENAVLNNVITFSITESDEYSLEYWAVDNVGNEEEHNFISNIKIDIDIPILNILKPDPGLYFFGKKIISLDKIILIGSFDIEIYTHDDHSGLYRTQFYLDDVLFHESTNESAIITCSEQHFGEGTLEVISEDFVNNINEYSLEIIYYKLFP